MRIVKEAEERRNEILDAASDLFSAKGFDKTSTNDILEKVGIARGTLYYHFKSKEDIMDALIQRYSIRLISAAKSIADDTSIPVVERMIRTIMSLNIYGRSGDEILEHIHKPQNALMHQKIQKLIICEVTPILTDIVKEGISQGIFNTPFPYEATETLVAYSNIIFDGDTVKLTKESKNNRIKAFIFNLERILGAESGSLTKIMKVFDNDEK